MAGKDATDAEAGDHEDSIRETLATLLEQTRQTLELLRTLIEDLIATPVTQNRDLLTIARRIQADARAIGDRLPASVNPDPDGQPRRAERSGHDEFPQDRGRLQGPPRAALLY